MSRAMREFSKRLLEARAKEQLRKREKPSAQEIKPALMDVQKEWRRGVFEEKKIMSCGDYGLCRCCALKFSGKCKGGHV